jgi:hypothetical protein
MAAARDPAPRPGLAPVSPTRRRRAAPRPCRPWPSAARTPASTAACRCWRAPSSNPAWPIRKAPAAWTTCCRSCGLQADAVGRGLRPGAGMSLPGLPGQPERPELQRRAADPVAVRDQQFRAAAAMPCCRRWRSVSAARACRAAACACPACRPARRRRRPGLRRGAAAAGLLRHASVRPDLRHLQRQWRRPDGQGKPVAQAVQGTVQLINQGNGIPPGPNGQAGRKKTTRILVGRQGHGAGASGKHWSEE